jgi:hypothetical protein
MPHSFLNSNTSPFKKRLGDIHISTPQILCNTLPKPINPIRRSNPAIEIIQNPAVRTLASQLPTDIRKLTSARR